jgi:hypothetical protein
MEKNFIQISDQLDYTIQLKGREGKIGYIPKK